MTDRNEGEANTKWLCYFNIIKSNIQRLPANDFQLSVYRSFDSNLIYLKINIDKRNWKHLSDRTGNNKGYEILNSTCISFKVIKFYY